MCRPFQPTHNPFRSTPRCRRAPDPDALCLHPKVKIEQNRVIGDLKAFDVKVMLGKADRVVAEIVGKPHLLRDIVQHSLIKLGPHAGETRLDLAAVADARKIEKSRFTLASAYAPGR